MSEIPPPASRPDMIFYDGHCGLCHRTVRFVLAQDRRGDLFRFAPIGGSTFLKTIPQSIRPTLPASVVVQTSSGKLITRSNAILYVLNRLGGVWRIWSNLGGLLPATLRDAVYNGIASVRYRLFPPPVPPCPRLPESLRRRFDP